MLGTYLDQGGQALYQRAYSQGWQHKVWSALIGRSRRLLNLATVQATCAVVGRHYAGGQTVPMDQIRGSLGRSNDFDMDFYPLQTHNRERWLNIAKARQRGVNLPPVELIQVGDVYFVLDGHHRISVARALGQKYIDAVVTVWQVAGSLPGEKPAAIRSEEDLCQTLSGLVAGRRPASVTLETSEV
jgi:hypothetical protein